MKSLKYSLKDNLIYLEDSKLYLEVDNEANSFNIILNDFSQNELLNVNTFIIGPHLIDFSQKDNVIVKTICKTKEFKEKFKDIITQEYIIPDENTSIIGKIKEEDLMELSTLLNYTISYVSNIIDFSLQEFISMKDFVLEYDRHYNRNTLYIKDKKLLSKLKAIREISTSEHFNLLMQFLFGKMEKLKDTECYYNFIRYLDIKWKNTEFKEIESYIENPKTICITYDFKNMDAESKEENEYGEEYEYEYESIDEDK